MARKTSESRDRHADERDDRTRPGTGVRCQRPTSRAPTIKCDQGNQADDPQAASDRRRAPADGTVPSPGRRRSRRARRARTGPSRAEIQAQSHGSSWPSADARTIPKQRVTATQRPMVGHRVAYILTVSKLYILKIQNHTAMIALPTDVSTADSDGCMRLDASGPRPREGSSRAPGRKPCPRHDSRRPWCSRGGPAPATIGNLRAAIAPMPGSTICPPCVCPLSISGTASAAASIRRVGIVREQDQSRRRAAHHARDVLDACGPVANADEVERLAADASSWVRASFSTRSLARPAPLACRDRHRGCRGRRKRRAARTAAPSASAAGCDESRSPLVT